MNDTEQQPPTPIKRVCVFCGSGSGTNPRYVEDARAFGQLLARQGIGLVYGGGNVGLMGNVADAALAGGGEVIGIIPHFLAKLEVAHAGITELQLVDTMHERKAQMAAQSDAFVALPGGLGTMEEIFESLTWALLGIHRKPCGFLNVDGYYDHLVAFIDHATADGLINRTYRDLILVETDGESMLDKLRGYRAPGIIPVMTESQV